MTGKKKRQFNWQAVEHVGNDADEGGFLGNEEAENERVMDRPPVSLVPPPGPEAEPVADATPGAVVAVAVASDATGSDDAPSDPVAVPVPAQQASDSSDSKAEVAPPAVAVPGGLLDQEQVDSLGAGPGAQGGSSGGPEAAAPSRVAARPKRPRRINDGPDFTASGSQPPRTQSKGRRAKEKETQAEVVASFINQRTSRNWSIWSGRLVPAVTKRLQDRADSDAASSGRSRLGPGHFFDAAIRGLPDDPAELAEIANTWLVEVWEGEHPRGENAQFSVSPAVHDKLSGLRRSLRGFRHGMVIDVVSAAADRLLDQLDAEGPLP